MSEIVLVVLCISLIGLHIAAYFAVKGILSQYASLTSTLSQQLRDDQEKFVRLAMSKSVVEYKQSEAISTLADNGDEEEEDLVPVESVGDNEFMKYIKKAAEPETTEVDGG